MFRKKAILGSTAAYK